ncbi:cytochrome P450 [Mycena rosella]|uniref:Cytochrome P450 n=1 Tax=Mycena rosella TaxID=1033263 RepID=A0AAD7G7G1_MYCRO|nr:cytochrome P450 [Mycena rosella]
MELLDRRSAIYSDRPTMVTSFIRPYPDSDGSISSGYGQPFVLQPYGDNWRQQRKIVAQDFSQIGIARYNSFVYGVMKDPATLALIQQAYGTIIIQCTYGHYLKDENDPFLTSPLTAMENFSKSTAPGAWLVDFLPLLQYMPKWMPGASFRSTAAKWRQIVWDTTWEPYLWLKENLVGSATRAYCISDNVFGPGLGNKPDQRARGPIGLAASTVMGAGMDTNNSTVLIFFLAMMLNPSVQAKARRELDDVIGPDRLPTLNDKPSLPYIRSIMAEVMRWHPVMPLGIAHSLSKDDIYEGMLLLKGSLMIPNVWYMLHDPEFYPNPDTFDPDRYQNVDSEMEKIPELIFGFGRRVCTFFLIVATILSTCEIVLPVDTKGNKVIPNITFSSGTIIFPSEFDVDIRCRSDKAREMLSSLVSDGAE